MHTAIQQTAMNSNSHSDISQAITFREIKVSSPAFSDGEMIPALYTCDGANINPPLDILNIPWEAKSLAIVMTGSYGDKEWSHWLAWNIPPVRHIEEGRKMEAEGLNYFGRKQYEGPCPSGGLHEYQFKVYALKELLTLHSCTTKEELEKAISDLIIGFGTISCHYRRMQHENNTP